LGILGTYIGNIGETAAAALMRKSSCSPVLLCFGNFDWELGEGAGIGKQRPLGGV